MELISTMEVIINILSFIAGMFLLYLTAYTQAKSKNKALLEDIKNLEDEKQKVIAKYRAETEDIKKQHSLDIEKRKFQYEAKLVQFTKYFKLLDEFNGKCNSVFIKKFQDAMTEFYTPHLADIEAKEENENLELLNRGNAKFIQDIQSVFFELSEEQLKINHEANSIRLISSHEVDLLLNDLELAVKLATAQTSELLKFMATQEFKDNQSLLAPFQEKQAKLGQSVTDGRNKLRAQMKAELNEI